MPARSDRGDHRHRHALADQPPLWGRHIVAAAQRILREIEALVEAVAADDEVVFVRILVWMQRVARSDHVAPTQLEGIQLEPLGEHVLHKVKGAKPNFLRIHKTDAKLDGHAQVARVASALLSEVVLSTIAVVIYELVGAALIPRMLIFARFFGVACQQRLLTSSRPDS